MQWRPECETTWRCTPSSTTGVPQPAKNQTKGLKSMFRELEGFSGLQCTHFKPAIFCPVKKSHETLFQKDAPCCFRDQ